MRRFEAYDPVTNSWETKASLPTERYWFAGGVMNGLIYAVDGYSPSMATVEASRSRHRRVDVARVADAQTLEQAVQVDTAATLKYAIDLACSKARLNASTVLMSGLGLPALTSTPIRRAPSRWRER